MQAVTEEQILAALSAVQDPSQNKDIVALGLVQAIQIKDSNISFMLVVPPHRGPAMEPIRKRAEQVALALLEGHHLLLDRALGDIAVDDDVLRLSDPMRTVDRLILGRRIPPRIHEEDVVCGFQRDAQTRCLQRRQHDGRTLAGFEGFDGGRPIASRTGQFEDWEIGVTEPDVFLENGQE